MLTMYSIFSVDHSHQLLFTVALDKTILINKLSNILHIRIYNPIISYCSHDAHAMQFPQQDIKFLQILKLSHFDLIVICMHTEVLQIWRD